MSFKTKTATLPSGITLPYAERGDRNGLPVIFLHGLTDSHLSMRPLIEALPDTIRAIAITQRGHGDASKPVAGYLAEDFAADVASFLDVMNIRAAVIVGHSLGSLNARAFAHAYPSRTLGLVLMGAFASVHGNVAVEELCHAVHDLTDPVMDAFARDFQISTIHHPIPDAFLNMAVSESLKVPAHVWKACVAGMKEHDRTFTGSGLAAPVLIAWGAHDTICSRADQETLKTAFNKSRLIIYPDAGHALHWEFPEAVAADLAAWLRPIERTLKKAA